jgi:hypothetical protein
VVGVSGPVPSATCPAGSCASPEPPAQMSPSSSVRHHVAPNAPGDSRMAARAVPAGGQGRGRGGVLEEPRLVEHLGEVRGVVA